jgi:uncharacterized protein
MKPNPVVHFEVPVADRERAKKFYTEAFGWQMQQMGSDMMDYVVAITGETEDGANGRPKNPGNINGGLYQKSDDPMRSHTSLVVSVDNLEEAMEKVKAAGGTIHGEPTDIPGVGRFVSIVDTEGNPMSMLQP